jgi:hypothetical protein
MYFFFFKFDSTIRLDIWRAFPCACFNALPPDHLALQEEAPSNDMAVHHIPFNCSFKRSPNCSGIATGILLPSRICDVFSKPSTIGGRHMPGLVDLSRSSYPFDILSSLHLEM